MASKVKWALRGVRGNVPRRSGGPVGSSSKDGVNQSSNTDSEDQDAGYPINVGRSHYNHGKRALLPRPLDLSHNYTSLLRHHWSTFCTQAWGPQADRDQWEYTSLLNHHPWTFLLSPLLKGYRYSIPAQQNIKPTAIVQVAPPRLPPLVAVGTTDQDSPPIEKCGHLQGFDSKELSTSELSDSRRTTKDHNARLSISIPDTPPVCDEMALPSPTPSDSSTSSIFESGYETANIHQGSTQESIPQQLSTCEIVTGLDCCIPLTQTVFSGVPISGFFQLDENAPEVCNQDLLKHFPAPCDT